MDEYFGFRNFRQFERSRGDVRIPCGLLNDRRFRQLSDAHKAHLLCLLLLAARKGNVLPNRAAKLGYLIGATELVDLAMLGDFIDVTRIDQVDRSTERRPISDRIRAAVLIRDGGRCRSCGSARHLEVDHIVPICKGGDAEESNLQTLCRRCNRRKWKRLTPRL
jgi:5-methylcytosine-specific restriction enzyme A